VTGNEAMKSADRNAGQGASGRSASRAGRKYATDLSAVGQPFLWAMGTALALGLMLIAGFLLMIFWNGATTFWPKPIHVVELADGTRLAGEPSRANVYRPGPAVLDALPEEVRARIEEDEGYASRVLYCVGNYDLYGEDFRWVNDFEARSVSMPKDFFLFERQEWGLFVGRIRSLSLDGEEVDAASLSRRDLHAAQHAARQRFTRVRAIERDEIGELNHHLEAERLRLRKILLSKGQDSPEYRAGQRRLEERSRELNAEYEILARQAADLRAEDARFTITLEEVGGQAKTMNLSQIVRFYAANDLGWLDRLGIYFSRWGEFLTSEPREANTEGGILPAIFGTVAMTLIMVIIVAPFGVITALYLREYAKQGRIVAMVRVSVNNLAGVPSIVYGVFGVGFFAYTLGASIDQLLYAERLPNPTFGTGGILWSALTLALLTVPVVIVAAEEALSAVPRSMREGSLACGASTWQTLRFVVLPRAMPGIMTGLILAMARGAGEVAPLMLVGVVKLAPELPIDGYFPYVHLERSFMHLGFHIFDVGFQSRNSEAGKPMVFVTTMLLLALIVLMNSSAIYMRNRLKKKFESSQF
jgi:phosphate transport system permease protein